MKISLKIPVIIALLLSGIMNYTYSQQNDNHPDKVTLRDGSTIIGQLVFSDDEIIMIQIGQSEEIISIRRDEVVKLLENEEKMYYYHKGKFDYLKGQFLQISGGLGFGFSGSGHINLQYARMISPRFSLGPGIGFASLNIREQFVSHQFADTYLYTRYNLSTMRKPNKWYLAGRTGYAFSISRNSPGILNYGSGIVGELGFGLHWSSKRKTKCSLELAYRFQRATGRLDNSIQFIHQDPSQIYTVSQDRTFVRNMIRFNIDIY